MQQAPPPANPYGVKRASLDVAGQTTGLPLGVEVRVGRDPARVGVLIDDPRVSGLHASFRFDGSAASVRDEGSSSGTYLDGQRVPSGSWQPLASATQIQLGPVPVRVIVS